MSNINFSCQFKETSGELMGMVIGKSERGLDVSFRNYNSSR